MKARTQQGQLTAADQDMLDEVTPVIEEHNLLFTKLLHLPYPTLTNLQQRAATYSGKALPDLGGMMLVHFPGSADELTVANDLLALNAVEYVSNRLKELGLDDDIPPTTPLLWGNQGYFGPDPGLDMDYSWSKASIGGVFNTRAKGIRLTQVEASWRLEHEDLVDRGVIVVKEGTDPDSFPNLHYHGNAVLGILAAEENAYGISGQASESTIQVAGRNIFEEGSYLKALIEAINNSAEGDVISISVSPGLGPLEVGESSYTQIMMAVDSGITVAMSAGNDNLDLDNTPGSIEDWLKLDDSGSIIVGAGTADTLHQRLDFSNYGQRVNVQGWGENVFTLGCVDPLDPSCFEYGGDILQQYSDFGGTSAAAPMIASAYASLQGFHKDRFGTFMDPFVLRQLLIDTGIPQGGADPESEHIGPFPDMRAAIDSLLDDPSVPLPFFDDFPSTTINVVNWPLGDGVIDDLGDAEPSAPYSLHLGPGQTLESASMVTTDACTVGAEIQATLTFWYQDEGTGTPPNGDLVVRYRDDVGSDPWPILRVIQVDGVSEFLQAVEELPAPALHDAFRIRFESDATVGDWFVDDVSITILSQPGFRLTPLTQVVCAGDPVNLVVIATGGNLAYQWKKDAIDIPGETQSTYSIPSVTLADDGDYTVVVSNDCNPTGVESPAGDLTVHERTQLGAITLDPPGQPVDCGVSVTLSATVTGTPTPDLQWYFGDLRMPILGATSDTLVIDSVVPSDEGDYILQATNTLACQVGEDDDLVETVPFFLDVDLNDPTCLGGAPFVKSVLSPLVHDEDTLYIGIDLDHGLGEPTTESRIGGVHTLEIMFDQAMDSATTEDTKNISVIGVNSGTIASGDMQARLDANATLLTLTFPGLAGARLPNQDRYTVVLSATIESAGPGGLPLAGDRDFDIRGLEADVNGDGAVDPLDSGAILARFGNPVEMNVQYDINTDGAINPLDSGAALARFGSSAP